MSAPALRVTAPAVLFRARLPPVPAKAPRLQFPLLPNVSPPAELTATVLKAAEFERLKAFLTVGKQDIPFGAAAAELGVSEGALRVTVHRLRKRFRVLFREEIGHTVTSAEDVEEEFRHLMTALSE